MMSHEEKITAIQTRDLPAFLSSLEEMYGKAWMTKNFAFMGVLCEEGAGGMFRTMGNGSNVNLMKIAHASIRSLAKVAAEQDPGVSEIRCIEALLMTLWRHMAADYSREGVPDGIFKAFMEADPLIPPFPPSSDAPPPSPPTV